MTEDQVAKLVEYLNNRNISAKLLDNDSSEVDIVFTVPINKKDFECICCLSDTFPNTFPVIKVGNELFEIVKDMPHIDSDKVLCTFDKGVVVPNRDAPEELVYKTIVKAICILLDGVAGDNKSDFIDEFYAYIGKRCNPGDSIIVGSYDDLNDFSYKVGNFIFLNKSSALKFSNDFLKIPVFEISPEDLLNFDYTVKNLYKITNKRNNLVYSFDKKTSILIHTIVDDAHYFLEMEIPKFCRMDGFRKTIKPANIFAMQNELNSNKKVICSMCQNAIQEYLYKRGSDGTDFSNQKVKIVGCGSVGSTLAYTLKDFGVINYQLVDNERLVTDNIGRHICGIKYVRKKKVEALKEVLLDHNKNIICDTYCTDAYKYIDNYCSDGAILFETTGELNICLTLIDKKKDSAIKDKIVIMWVEPYCASCHMIVLNNSNIDRNTLFDEEGTFKFNALHNGSSLNKRFSGCQSTFIPYNGSVVKMFVARVLTELFSNRLNNENNYVLSFTGDIDRLKDVGCIFKNKFKNFELKIEVLK